MKYVILVVMLWLSAVCDGQAQGMKGGDGTVIRDNDTYDFIGVNRMLMWISNNGSTSHNPATDASGFEWPLGSGKHIVYQEGLVFGGMVGGEVRIGGSTYRQGLQAGYITPSGQPSDADDPENRIFKAHRFDTVWWHGLPQDQQDRLLTDLREWPVTHGAPWIDANANGIYDPDPLSWALGGPSDTPLLPGDEVLWFVSNDLDGTRTSNLYGSPPMGVEVRTMAWASAGHPLLADVVFREYTLINRSANTISDMRLAIWEDADFGSPSDDLVGVDTTLGLAYDYNGTMKDEVYGLPAAAGVVWLQTPIVPAPGKTARYGLGSRGDHENLSLSGFSFYINSDPTYQDPDLGTPEGSFQMMNNLSGRLYDGGPFIDPVTSGITRFPLSGDPVLASGWTDGIVHGPGDRRCMSNSGMFTLAPGDTQKVIVARVVAEGKNHLLSVRALRSAARQLHDIYRNLPMGSPAPMFSSSISYPTANSYAVQVTGGPFPAGTVQVEGLLRGIGGGEIQRVMLHDDGAHGDGAAADGIYGGVLSGAASPSGADLLLLSTNGGEVHEWFVESEVALPGEVRVAIVDVASDSRNFDGHVNPGENVRLRLRIDNQSSTELGPWHLFLRDDVSLFADRTEFRYDAMTIGGGSYQPVYDPKDGNSYLGVTIPNDIPPGTILRMPVSIMSENRCLWNDTLAITIEDFVSPPFEGLLAHVQGRATGSLGYVVVDKGALTDHDYRISIEGEDFGTKSMHVEDLTLGTTLYRGLPIPDSWGHASQLIAGLRINIGTAFDAPVYDQNGDKLPSFTESVTGTFSEPSRAWFVPYIENIRTGEDFLGSRIRQYDEVPVRLVFDRVNGQKAMAWLRGGSPNYRYEGYYNIPVRAYDMSDSANPRQIMLGFVEQNASPAHDQTWMPTTSPGDREYLFVFADDYSEQVDPKFQVPIMNASEDLDVLYGLWVIRDESVPLFVDGDAYSLNPRIPVSNRDVYITPRILADVHGDPTQPSAVALHANYPNPFGSGIGSGGASTTIRFETPRNGHALLAVFDMLGRRVATLVDQVLPSGSHSVRFDGTALRAGTYIVVLDALGMREARTISVLR
ncbi:MAG: T9SS type A sorting domain-containing protein [Bacteroidetes bacterium]|nr:T9SS type A sorting domain-containing protein [Bacteroidota bacterium]